MEQADEEEKQKQFQNKVKQKKRASHAISRSAVNSDTDTTVKQKEEEKVDRETVDRRTVFVGNLPVNCTAQVCERILSARVKVNTTVFSLFSSEKLHIVTKIAFYESKKQCSLPKSDLSWLSGVRLFTAVDAVGLSLVDLISFWFNEKQTTIHDKVSVLLILKANNKSVA